MAHEPLSPNVLKNEFTLFAVVVGLIGAVIMTAANMYLGLYAGMTVGASIPAAVIAMGVYRALGKNDTILGSNIIQTMVSAGSTVASGAIFTLPALILSGVWTEFEFWPTTLMALCGSVLGVVFMIPMRKALIVDNKELTYPEGVACANVLRAGGDASSGQGIKTIMAGFGLGGLFKFAASGLGWMRETVESATRVGNSVLYGGTDISAALLAVGYIVKLEVAALVFAGGAVGFFVVIPFLGGDPSLDALDTAMDLWKSQVRYIGVGAMIIAGMSSIISVRRGIIDGVTGLKGSYSAERGSVSRVEQNMSPRPLFVLMMINLVVMFGLFKYLIGDAGLTLVTTFMMLLMTFLFVAVSSYVVGLVGSSNNPVSGMTISALLGTAVFFLLLGYHGKSAILATLGVAAVVCCAACTAGDTSQDLKTGYLVHATPRFQQIAAALSVVLPSLIVAPILTLLHHSYGIGTGLKAPQAKLFASITEGIFGQGQLPYNMVIGGMIAGLAVLALDAWLKHRKIGPRLYLMPLAVGIYLPFSLSVPILLGGLVSHIIERQRGTLDESRDQGILLSSGLIAGEAIMGVLLAVIIWQGWNIRWVPFADANVPAISLLALLGLTLYLYRVARR
jgi:putative OPT family oligopeptide transporter